MTLPVPPQPRPEILDSARQIAELLSDLDAQLEALSLSDDERRDIQTMILEALECHMTGQYPSSETVAFWMRLLDPAVTLLDACADQ